MTGGWIGLATFRAGSWGRVIAGAEGGAPVGAAVGSVVPVLGTAAEAVVGGVAGGVGGDWVSRRAYNRIKNWF